MAAIFEAPAKSDMSLYATLKIRSINKNLAIVVMMKCAACAREPDDGRYCRYHAKALLQLKSHHGSWVDAYGAISWQDYLKRLHKMEETGQWAREVIEVEMKKEKEKDGQ